MTEYYLPAGNWTSFWTGEAVEGGRWYTETVGFLQIPLFVRENTLLPMGATENRCDYDYQADLTLHLFGLADGHAATATVPGDQLLTVTARREGSQITITSSGFLPKARVQISQNGRVFEWFDTTSPLRFDLPTEI